MRQIRQFRTDDADLLSTQLSKLEDNVSAETASIRQSYLPTPVPTPHQTKGGGTFTTGQCLMADTAIGGPFAVNLAPPPDNAPGLLIVVVNSPTNAVTLTPQPPALIMTTATYPIAAGVHYVWFDGTNWWSS